VPLGRETHCGATKDEEEEVLEATFDTVCW
jgi:hypothetical protein